jgi:hypothetical protein
MTEAERVYLVTMEGQKVHRVTQVEDGWATTRCGLLVEDERGVLRKLGLEYRQSGRLPRCTRCEHGVALAVPPPVD